MKASAWLTTFLIVFLSSVALAQDLAVENAQLCTEYDAATRVCETPLREGEIVDLDDVDTLFLYCEVASDVDSSVIHVWIRMGEVEPGDPLFAPRIDIRSSDEAERNILLSLERTNPWALVLRAIQASGRQIWPAARQLWDITKGMIGSLIFELGLSKYVSEVQEGVRDIETSEPTTRVQYQEQAMIAAIHLAVAPGARYRTVSSKRLDRQVHAGDWHAMIFTSAGKRLWHQRFSVAAVNNQ